MNIGIKGFKTYIKNNENSKLVFQSNNTRFDNVFVYFKPDTMLFKNAAGDILTISCVSYVDMSNDSNKVSFNISTRNGNTYYLFCNKEETYERCTK